MVYYRRFGKLSFTDHITSVFGICILLLILCINIVLNGCSLNDIMYYLIIIVIVSVWLIRIFYPYTEKFQIDNNKINIVKFKKRCEVTIPKKSTIIISYTDIRYSMEIQSIMLKDKFSVCIVEEKTHENTLLRLHNKFVYKYSNSTIESSFKNSFVYSFVYKEELLEMLLHNDIKTIIVPESLINSIDILKFSEKVFIDIGY